MIIEICVSCTWFQRRLCWMASSLLQQKGNVPNIIFNVAYPKNNGTPRTEDVCKFFREQGLNVKETVYPDEKSIQFRGLVRNKQLVETNADFILFSDSDMVYDPFFFEDLQNQLENTDLGKETRCITSSRISLEKDYSKNYFNNEDKQIYPRVIDGVASLVEKWPVYRITRASGAGYFQLANVENIRENCGGLYVDPKNCADVPEFEKFHKTKSDRQFRVRLGGRRAIKVKNQYHLNHERDNEQENCKHIIWQR